MKRWWGVGGGVLLLTLVTFIASAAGPKRVLIVHSFVNAAPPFTTHSMAFETTLTTEMGEWVDLDEITLDVARYATADMEETLVEYLRKRVQKWQPDLVVPVGSPAGVFVAQYRDRLFPLTPVIYTGMDRQDLLPDALQKNATLVGEALDFPGMVEDILQVSPATTNITVVLGASQLERSWAAAIQREWQPFTNRVSFTWLNELSFDQMLARVATLPPRSFIFVILLMRDASGVPHNVDEAINRIRAVANAPVNSVYQHQLGLGIVGGRLYQAELEGEEAARIAIRILRGEPATNFPPKIIGPLGPRYDARELQRWNISADRLPPGSVVLFRESPVWERYRWRIVAIVSLCAVEALLIFGLLKNLIKRRGVERSLKENKNQLTAILDTAAEGIITINDRGIIESVNLATEKIFGYAAAEMIGQNVSMLMPKPFHEETDQPPANDHQAHQPKIIGIGREVGGRRKDGSEVPLDLTVSEIALADRRVFTGFVRDITARKETETVMQDLSRRLIRAHEAERARLARELHDDVTQRLARLAIDAGRVERGADGVVAAEMMRSIREGLVRLSGDIHALSYRLHPSVLEDLGLAEALKAECERFSRQESVSAAVTLRELPAKVPLETALCLFRVTQEALRNAARHAQAHRVDVSVRCVDGCLQLAVIDDGIGFDPARQRTRPSLGLASMRERVLLVQGELDIESAPGRGTTILVSVPLTKAQAEA